MYKCIICKNSDENRCGKSKLAEKQIKIKNPPARNAIGQADKRK